MTDLSDAALIQAFETCALTPAQFSHRSHVRIGYLYLKRYDFGQAVSLVSSGLRALVTHLGLKDKYHETITVAFMALINERLSRDGDPGDWPSFARTNKDLLSVDILHRYYDKEDLFSDTARQAFVMSAGPSNPQ